MKTARHAALTAVLTCALVLLTGTPAGGVGGEAVKPKTPPTAPEVPVPPKGPGVPELPKPPGERPSSTIKRYYLAPGATNKGDLYFFSDSVHIAGTQDGDLTVFARELEIPGTVTGDINASVQTADLGGTMGDAVRVVCQDLQVTGTIKGDLIAMCAKVVVDRSAHISGDVTAVGANIEVRGDIDGSLEATGGEVVFSGKTGGDAKLKADVVQVDPGAHVGGDLDYSSRERVDFDIDKLVKGKVNYSLTKPKPVVSRHGFMTWFFLMSTGLLLGLAAVSIFRQSAIDTAATVRADGLKSAGIGFITAIVVPVAALISCILIITIPAAILVLLGYLALIYLAQVPVAVCLGGLILKRVSGTASSPFLALAMGVPVLYLLFAIPFIGKIAIFATVFTGLGAIVVTAWNARQARRGGQVEIEPPVAPAPVL
jgi:cytoskeletal protein CcmA (bactofilin family)